LLERLLIIIKKFDLKKIDFGDISNDNSKNDFDENYDINSNSPQLFPFEKRICNLVESLINHIKEYKSQNPTNKLHQLISNSEPSFNFINNEHEGKNLFHLCAESGLCLFFIKLNQLKNVIKDEDIFLRTELDLLKLDLNGETPIVNLKIFFTKFKKYF
jgi:hypothetical protein